VAVGADERGVAVDGDGAAKAVAGRSVGREQLLLEHPAAARPEEHVGRAGLRALLVVATGTHDGEVASDG
jgi:hypothetical protein